MEKRSFCSVCAHQLLGFYMTRVCTKTTFRGIYLLNNISPFNAEAQMFHSNIKIYSIWLIFILCVCLTTLTRPHKIPFLGHILHSGDFLEIKIKGYLYMKVTTS